MDNSSPTFDPRNMAGATFNVDADEGEKGQSLADRVSEILYASERDGLANTVGYGIGSYDSSEDHLLALLTGRGDHDAKLKVLTQMVIEARRDARAARSHANEMSNTLHTILTRYQRALMVLAEES